MRFQPLLAKIAFAAMLAGLVVAVAACAGTRLHQWDFAFGVRLLAPGAGLGAAGFLFGAAWLWRALAMNNSLGWHYGLAGLLGAALIVGIPADYLWRCYTLPPIHDISTDIGDAPKFETLLAWRKGASNPAGYDGPLVVTYEHEKMTTAVAQKGTYPDIKPLERLDNRTPQRVLLSKYFWRALNAVNALGWQVASFDLKKGRIEATDTSLWFGTVSDIVIRVRPAGAIGVRIDIRAKSRRGEADGGRNARLIRDFLELESGR